MVELKKIIIVILLIILAGCSYSDRDKKQGSRLPIVNGGINENYRPPMFDPDKSITYRMSYKKLKHQLQYARITVPDKKGGHETIRRIDDQDRLLQIVREFDRLKSSVPKEKEPTRLESTFYVVTMWREGSSVSYVILESNDQFYYEESDHLLKRKMPDSLLRLLEFK